MAFYFLLCLVGFACALALGRWRSGVVPIILIAAVQDPLRKLVPGAPGYLVLASAPVLAVVAFSLVTSKPAWWNGLARHVSFPARTLPWFVLACVPAATISGFYGEGSWMLTVLGAFSYGIPLAAILIGYYYPRSHEDLRRFLKVYCLVTTVALTGTLVEYLNLWPDARILGTSAMGFDWIRYRQGYAVDLIAGFYRSPDVMGWHAATAVMFAAILGFTAAGNERRWWLSVAGFALIALLLSGRRKMVFMPVVFAATAFCLYWQNRRKGRLAGLLSIAVPIVAALAVLDSIGVGADSSFLLYYTQGSTEVLDQLEGHGISSLIVTYQQSGFFGGGLGVATPGSHHLNVARPPTWQESAPSRILVELGVPGMLAFAVLIGGLVLAAYRTTIGMLRVGSPNTGYAVGFFAFFLANAGSLIVSGQILADPAIAALIGMSIGFVLALERVHTAAALRVRQAAPLPQLQHRRALPPPRPRPQPALRH